MSNSLIKVLNVLAGSSLVVVYSKWMLSIEKLSVRFTINNDKVFYEKSQLILLPTLETGTDKVFKGWYTDSACTNILTNFNSNTYTELYGKY